ncbi:MAG: hypothetical protein ABR606_01635, partial [Vicinamibacterales bacterium]
ARIEQLLLTGLDHYFAADYDQAINLWTRVLFLDRHHDRARAYIERARSAEAECQRESEALLHEGLQAFDEGEVDKARQLLSAAMDRGAPHDMALGVLDRIERLDIRASARPASGLAPVAARTRAVETTRKAERDQTSKTASTVWLAVVFLVALTAAGAWEMSLDELTAWARWRAASDGAGSLMATTVQPLPVPAASERALTRAQAHFAAGRVRDALASLDHVPIGDLRRADADRLRGQIQRELLAAAAALRATSAPVIVPDE